MKKIVIIGGGAAGPKTAAKSRRMNKENIIELYTQEDIISYSACGMPYFIEGVVKNLNQLIIRTPEDFEKQGVKVFLNHRAQKILPKEKVVIINDKKVSYDELVLCTGACASIPKNIKNPNVKNVFLLKKLPDSCLIKEKMHASKKAIIIGGGYICVELLEAFIHNNVEVDVVERSSRFLKSFDSEFSDIIKNHILERDGKKVRFHFDEEVAEFVPDENGNFKKLITKNGLELSADFVVVAAGVKPNVDLAKEAGIEIGETGGILVDKTMKTSVENIWAAGDCTQERCYITGRPLYFALGTIANKEGRVAAINISKAPKMGDTFEGVLGSLITKYFDFTIAMTGLTQEAATRHTEEFDLIPISTTVVKKDKAGYMPNSEDITLKVVADKKTGKLLGAQCVGTGDVNKRISTITTGLQSRATVDEFLHMDLPYAPPYSSTIDAVLTAVYRLNAIIKDEKF